MLNGWTKKPSATSPATAVIAGPDPGEEQARRTRLEWRRAEERRHQRVAVVAALEARAACRSASVAQIARIAPTISRIRAAGCDHGIENRFSMWGRICEPSPRMARPLRRRSGGPTPCGRRSSGCGRTRPRPRSSGRCARCARRRGRGGGTGRAGPERVRAVEALGLDPACGRGDVGERAGDERGVHEHRGTVSTCDLDRRAG